MPNSETVEETELSNSSLATYQLTSTGNYNSRTAQISGIVIHNAATVGTCNDLRNILASTAAGSFNYGIATDGTIGLFLDEMYRPWSTGNPEIDHKTISIVLCNSSLASNYPISDATYVSLMKLCTDICYRNSISQLKYTGNPSGSNLYKHSWYADVNCPGNYISSLYDRLVSDVNTALKSLNTNNSTTAALRNSTGVQVNSISPYVVCVDSNVASIDYQKLIQAKVVGALFYCGGLYTSTHDTKNNYQSSTLASQIKSMNGAMPYGLYCDVRAKNEKEARLECKKLYYVISNYPPKLGIWLKLDLGQSNSVNDTVLSVYYDYLTQWGLKSKCGIYCDKKQLANISWTSTFCTKYSLMIIDHQPSLNGLETQVSTEFFKV